MDSRLSGSGIEAFSSVASSYEDWFESPLGKYVDSLEMESLDRILEGIEGSAAIEIGAGTGHIARRLLSRFGRVVAVEPSQAMREEGMRRTDDTRVSWYDDVAERLRFAEGSFDCALFFTVLEFVDDPRKAIREALRVVRPGGRLVVGYLHPLSPWSALYRHLGERGTMPWAAARFYTRDELEHWVGYPAEACEGAVHLTPSAVEPYGQAESAGVRAGNPPAVEILRWMV
jgi:ubiquinone/menaquinone biosynthesis C-methylase UbiE